MKKLILLFIIFPLCVQFSFADEIKFEYDDAGNCTKKYKTITLKRSQQKSNTDNEISEEDDNGFENPTESFFNMIDNIKVSIYPNPTESDLSIEITGYSSNLNYNVVLTDIKGRTIFTANSNESYYKINMANYSPGAYILIVKLDNKKSEWKIIKK